MVEVSDLISITNSNFAVSDKRAYKIGKIVFVSFSNVNVKDNIAIWGVIGTLATGVIPIKVSIATGRNNDGTKLIQIYFSPSNNTIVAASALPKDINCMFSTVYFCA